MLLDLLSNTPTATETLAENDLTFQVETYFNDITSVEEIDQHFYGTESEYFSDIKEGKTRLSVSSTDLFLLLELIYQNLSGITVRGYFGCM
jgi:hypothetical protein